MSTKTRPAFRSTGLRQLSQEALEELRYLILELRPPELERDGLATTLRKHVEVLRRVQGGVPDVELELDGEPPADASRDRELLRIAQEALQNAIRHSGATRIVLRLAADNARLVLEVRDDGTGFDPQATEVRGRRLGLSSMEERARRLDGQLVINSVAGSGTTVRLEAPLSSSIRVLVVDDHAVVREGLRTFLRLQEGIEVVGEAGDGEEAVAQAQRLTPDVVLMDLVMPKLDGVEAMQRIRAERAETRVIVLTSFGDDDKLLPAVRAGAAGYLLKSAEPRRSSGRSGRRTRARR